MADVLVTGGAGFIGSNLVHALAGEGRAVRVLDDFSTGRRENLAGSEGAVDVLEASLTDPGACRRACQGVDVVFHQGAVPSVARSVAHPQRTHEVNATGTLRLLEAARDAGVRRFVYAGSSSAYGDTPTLPKREGDQGVPRSPYAVSKLAGEFYCQAFHSVYGLETVCLRYFNIFGERQDPGSEYSAAIPLFIRHALDGTRPTIFGDGGQTRDFTHVANVVHANTLAAGAPAARVAGQVFNIGCGEQTSVLALWRRIAAEVGSDVAPRFEPSRAGDVRDSLASLERSGRDLGYAPRVGLGEGIRRTVAWFRDRR
jgi:nucleoside-diphosphate-sugar epimerase